MEKSYSKFSDDMQEIIILPNGDTYIEWVSVPFSEFIIDYVLGKEEREKYNKYDCRRIYCG